MKTLSPRAALSLIEQGALLVDIRSQDEYDREHIALARLIPLERLPAERGAIEGAATVIFHCRSGHRTRAAMQTLRACANGDACLLEGGLDAWKQAGLPVVADTSRPLPLNRQVQIAAGAMVVLGAVLGAIGSPWFHLLSGLVGAGLVFAGISGFCGLARVLMKMPWNRQTLSS